MIIFTVFRQKNNIIIQFAPRLPQVPSRRLRWSWVRQCWQSWRCRRGRGGHPDPLLSSSWRSIEVDRRCPWDCPWGHVRCSTDSSRLSGFHWQVGLVHSCAMLPPFPFVFWPFLVRHVFSWVIQWVFCTLLWGVLLLLLPSAARESDFPQYLPWGSWGRRSFFTATLPA